MHDDASHALNDLSYTEQNDLYKRGSFGNPPPKVTNARGGQSNHNFGIAWDGGVFENGKTFRSHRYTTRSRRSARPEASNGAVT